MSQIYERAQELVNWLFEQKEVHSQLHRQNPTMTNKGALAAYNRHCKSLQSIFLAAPGQAIDAKYVDNDRVSAYMQLSGAFAQKVYGIEKFPDLKEDVETSQMILQRVQSAFPDQASSSLAA